MVVCVVLSDSINAFVRKRGEKDEGCRHVHRNRCPRDQPGKSQVGDVLVYEKDDREEFLDVEEG